jgi:hypothetical protein
LEVVVPAESNENPLSTHASRRHQGFSRDQEGFQEARKERSELVRQFLAVMKEAGRPGQKRKLGSSVLQLTGQSPEHYWGAILEDDEGKQREVLVFDDGTHGWSDEIAYSDRPRTPNDEISPEHLKDALDAILREHKLSWPAEPQNSPADPGGDSPAGSQDSPAAT